MLRNPDISLPFLVQTNASETGLGAVPSQELDSEEDPVIYISRVLRLCVCVSQILPQSSEHEGRDSDHLSDVAEWRKSLP